VQIEATTGHVMRVQSTSQITAELKYARIWKRELHTGDLVHRGKCKP